MGRLSRGSVRLASLLSILSAGCAPVPGTRWIAYVGGAGPAIGVYRFDPERGVLTKQSLAVYADARPTFLAVDAKKRRVYAADESEAGGVKALAMDARGDLTPLNDVAVGGAGPTHVALDTTGHWLLSANYVTGEVAAFGLNAAGAFAGSQASAWAGVHAHQALVAPGGAVVVPCLGDNHLAQFDFDERTGQFDSRVPRSLPTGSGGPRHLAVHPNRPWLYLANELNSTLQMWTSDGGTLTPRGKPVSTLTQAVAGNSAAEVQVHPNGRYVYVSNRGDDSIGIFALTADGAPTLLKTVKTGGAVPRHFSLDAGGRWLLVANQGSSLVTVLQVAGDGADLRTTQQRVAFPTPQFVQVYALF